jgi:hypothetical protein
MLLDVIQPPRATSSPTLTPISRSSLNCLGARSVHLNSAALTAPGVANPDETEVDMPRMTQHQELSLLQALSALLSAPKPDERPTEPVPPPDWDEDTSLECPNARRPS